MIEDDNTWSSEKIRGMIEGEVVLSSKTSSGEPVDWFVEVQQAFEQRCRTVDGHASVEDLLDVMQLTKAVNAIQDLEVKAFMAAAMALGCTDAWTCDREVRNAGLRTTSRSTEALFERGIKLVLLHERSRRSLLRRVRAHIGQSDEAVCWRCLKNPVTRIGDECGTECPAIAVSRRTGKRREIEDMSVEELVATQEESPERNDWHATIPGGAYYRKMVKAGGLDPTLMSSWRDIPQSDGG
jgi:hypothetical protein